MFGHPLLHLFMGDGINHHRLGNSCWIVIYYQSVMQVGKSKLKMLHLVRAFMP